MERRVEMTTAMGHNIWFDRPRLTTIDPEDLRTHTRNICRYNGALEWHLIRHLHLCGRLMDHWLHTKYVKQFTEWIASRAKAPPKSIGESQMHPASWKRHWTNRYIQKARKNLAIHRAYACSHDFHEIYVQDIVSGFKSYMPEYRRIELEWETYVGEQIGLPLEHRNQVLVRWVDVRALVIEMWYLGHPAYERCAADYGGPVLNEEKILIAETAQLSRDECWNQVWKNTVSGRSELKTWLKQQESLQTSPS